MPTNLLFAPFVVANRLKYLGNLIKKIVAAMQAYIDFAIPIVLVGFGLIFFITFFRKITVDQKSSEKKLIFVSGLVFLMFSVICANIWLGTKFNNAGTIIIGLLTVFFSFFVPLCLAMVYLYSAIFCSDQAACPRLLFSHNPPKLIKLILLGYLIFVWHNLATIFGLNYSCYLIMPILERAWIGFSAGALKFYAYLKTINYLKFFFM